MQCNEISNIEGYLFHIHINLLRNEHFRGCSLSCLMAQVEKLELMTLVLLLANNFQVLMAAVICILRSSEINI